MSNSRGELSTGSPPFALRLLPVRCSISTSLGRRALANIAHDVARDKLRVFISYSREDLEFVDQLKAGLDPCGVECIVDFEGISGGEDWKRRLGDLISEADTMIFVLTPESARSEICAWEAQEAIRLNKRIVPVNWRPLEGASPPPELRERNYIFFYEDHKAAPGSGFGTGLAKLVAALNTDFDWLREHTRYLQRATEWDRGGRPANRLLSGNDIAEAKAWAARRPKNAPEPTALHLDFILASEEDAEARSNAQRKQLDERERALKQAADAQRKRATIRNIALVVVSILAVLVLGNWMQAERQRQIAEEQKAETDRVLEAARKIIPILYAQVDINTQKQVLEIVQTGADRGDAPFMDSLGLAYEREIGVTLDYVKAREWYEKAANKGYPPAMRNLGALYHYGQGVAEDCVRAREWYEKAANKGDAFAMRLLGSLYREGRGGIAQDYATARRWYEKAANKGDAFAMRSLGSLYRDGLGVPQDYATAREWYEKAADKGDATAKAFLEAGGVK
jgi:TPR repeat protein